MCFSEQVYTSVSLMTGLQDDDPRRRQVTLERITAKLYSLSLLLSNSLLTLR